MGAAMTWDPGPPARQPRDRGPGWTDADEEMERRTWLRIALVLVVVLTVTALGLWWYGGQIEEEDGDSSVRLPIGAGMASLLAARY